MNTILVPTDFSKISGNATDYASEIAKRTKSKIVLLHVYSIPILPGDAAIVLPEWDAIEKNAMESLHKKMRSLHRKFGKDLEIECVCKIGFAVDEIINVCNSRKEIGLIVMGMHGVGYLEEKLFGSITTSLIKRSKCPVMVINGNVKYKPLKKIVLASDYETMPETPALKPVLQFAKIFKSQIFVLNVVKTLKELPSPRVKVTAEKGIENTLHGIIHSFHTREDEDTITGINKFVEAKNADLIAIFPHKHKFLDRVLHESNTKRMAFHTTVPLLALHG